MAEMMIQWQYHSKRRYHYKVIQLIAQSIIQITALISITEKSDIEITITRLTTITIITRTITIAATFANTDHFEKKRKILDVHYYS